MRKGGGEECVCVCACPREGCRTVTMVAQWVTNASRTFFDCITLYSP